MKKHERLTEKQKQYLEDIGQASIFVEDLPANQRAQSSGQAAKELNAELLKKMQAQADQQTVDKILNEH